MPHPLRLSVAPRARVLFAGALLAFAVSGHAASFTLLRDTIDLRATTPYSFPSTDFLVNASSDTLRLDSASVRLVKPASYNGHLQFYLIEGSYPSYSLYQGFLGSNLGVRFGFTQETKFAVIPHATARMVQAGFDGCILCPTTKRQASASPLALGDSLKAWVTFYSGSFRDSVLFLGLEKNLSALTPAEFPTVLGLLPARRVDPAGRALRAPTRHFLTAPAKR